MSDKRGITSHMAFKVSTEDPLNRFENVTAEHTHIRRDAPRASRSGRGWVGGLVGYEKSVC